jgi:hypothetical protein
LRAASELSSDKNDRARYRYNDQGNGNRPQVRPECPCDHEMQAVADPDPCYERERNIPELLQSEHDALPLDSRDDADEAAHFTKLSYMPIAKPDYFTVSEQAHAF